MGCMRQAARVEASRHNDTAEAARASTMESYNIARPLHTVQMSSACWPQHTWLIVADSCCTATVAARSGSPPKPAVVTEPTADVRLPSALTAAAAAKVSPLCVPRGIRRTVSALAAAVAAAKPFSSSPPSSTTIPILTPPALMTIAAKVVVRQGSAYRNRHWGS
ncbi:hypothetical protein Vafri_2136 [Volvox africanus]|nr:hypothetical protein Vafri_2136 [Volvox africanus]